MERIATATSSLARLLLLLGLLCHHVATVNGTARYDVVDMGAKPDGKADSSIAFLKAWLAACASAGVVTIYVPPGKYFLSKVTFNGPCRNKDGIDFRVEGTLLAPSSYQGNESSRNWIIFRNVTRVSIYGGVFDGRGETLWSCKSSGKSCPTGATNLEFSNSKDVLVSGLTSLDSQIFHIVISGCSNVKIQGATIVAPESSPNTDGIHVEDSTDVNIIDTKISTGDDCISVGPASKSLWIENITCGPGHGISIGSLGKVAVEQGVESVTVSMVTFSGTKNGVRIKSWARPINGFARNIVFQHVAMSNVKNPIIIDQHYCPNDDGCPDLVSGVKVSNITYMNIRGSSATSVGVKLNCSSKNPCTGIKMQDVKIMYKERIALASCSNAEGSMSGSVQPSDCF